MDAEQFDHICFRMRNHAIDCNRQWEYKIDAAMVEEWTSSRSRRSSMTRCPLSSPPHATPARRRSHQRETALLLTMCAGCPSHQLQPGRSIIWPQQTPRRSTNSGCSGQSFERLNGRPTDADLERLIKQRKTVVARAIKSIQDFCRENGVQLSSSALSEIEQSLQAALADERGATAVFSRRLIKPVRSDGLDPVDLSGALAGPAPRARKSELSSSDRTAAAPVKPVAPKPVPAVVARTRRAAEKADATVELLLKERSTLDGEHDALEQDVKALQQQFDELEKRRVDLDLRDSRLDTATRKAITASRDAHRAAD